MVDSPRLLADKPSEMKFSRQLCVEDFRRHPVWVVCRFVDADEPWYDEDVDGDAVRPWHERPVDPMQATFYVACTATLVDDSSWEGYLLASRVISIIWYQPHLYLPTGFAVGFWGGLFGVAECVRNELYRALGRSSDEVFPIEFRVPDGALELEHVPEATVHGFSRIVMPETRAEWMKVTYEV